MQGTYSKPQLAAMLPILKDLKRTAQIRQYRDALSEVIMLVAEVVSSQGDSVTINTTEEL